MNPYRSVHYILANSECAGSLCRLLVAYRLLALCTPLHIRNLAPIQNAYLPLIIYEDTTDYPASEGYVYGFIVMVAPISAFCCLIVILLRYLYTSPIPRINRQGILV